MITTLHVRPSELLSPGKPVWMHVFGFFHCFADLELVHVLAEHLLDEDRSNIGLLHRQEVKRALCARSLAFSSR